MGNTKTASVMLSSELRIYVLVRDYLKQKETECILGIGPCEDCGMCWSSPEDKDYIVSLFDARD